MSAETSEVRVSRNEAGSRYEAWIGDQLAGITAYTCDAKHILFTHTEVDEHFEGQGVGSALARGVFDDVRAHEPRRVVVSCPFLKTWLTRHPHYQDLTHR